MIKEILTDLTTKIGLFDAIPLVEEIEGKRMAYLGRSEYKEVDIEKGGAFYVMESMEQDRDEGITCEDDILRSYRIDLHINVKRKDLPCDDEFAFDRLANDIIGKIQMRDRALAKVLGIQYIDTEVSSVSGEEGTMSKHYLFIRLGIVINTRFSAKCLTTLC